MEFDDVVMQRYACRAFTSQTIPESEIDKLLELIRWTPSGLNLQTWKIKIVRDLPTKQEIAQAAFGQQQAANCSHLLVLCTVQDVSGQIEKLEKTMIAMKVPEAVRVGQIAYARDLCTKLSPEALRSFAENQVYMALANALNGAKSLGIDSCPMTGFDHGKVGRILDLPAGIVATALVPLGYGAGKAGLRLRFPVEEILL